MPKLHRYGDIVLDAAMGRVTCGAVGTDIPPGLTWLLLAFIQASGEIRTRDDLCDVLWKGPQHAPISAELLRVRIFHLRRVLKRIGSSVTIAIRHGYGWYLVG